LVEAIEIVTDLGAAEQLQFNSRIITGQELWINDLQENSHLLH